MKHDKGSYEELTINYTNGKPTNALLNFISKNKLLLSTEQLRVSSKNAEKYFSIDKTTYEYDSNDLLLAEKLYKKNKLIQTKKYSYKFNEEVPFKNWIYKSWNKGKQHIDREIVYYE